MNKVSFWKMPYYALFSSAFYRWATGMRLSGIFRYLAYLSVLSTLVALLVLNFRIFPVVDRFALWMQATMPTLQVTSQGLLSLADQESPFTMVHPNLGPLIRFDTSLDTADATQLNDVWILVTSKRVYMRYADGRMQVYDVFDSSRVNNLPENAFVTPQMASDFYQNLKPWAYVAVSGAAFLFFFFWKAMIALLYSWIGLILNMTRQEKLTFTSVFCISIFAMTPAILFQWFRVILPVFRIGAFGILTDFVLTVVYLYIGIKTTEEPNSQDS